MPSIHLSADLTLRFLPVIFQRAKSLYPDDPLPARLADILRHNPPPTPYILAGPMAEPPQGSAWPQLRRGLVIFAILAGGMAVFSLIGGRRGDFEAGLPGAIVGGLAAAVVVGVELIARRLARKQPGADGKGAAEPIYSTKV